LTWASAFTDRSLTGSSRSHSSGSTTPTISCSAAALTLEADVTAGTVKESTVVRVLCAMVARVFINPEGNLSEQIDDYSYSRDALVASGALTVTQAELADITPGRRASRSVRLIAHGETT
jgi:hypothetical protein